LCEFLTINSLKFVHIAFRNLVSDSEISVCQFQNQAVDSG